MVAVYLDTSVLVRRYLPGEPGHRRVRGLCAPGAGHSIFVGRLAALEVASALARKSRLGDVTPLAQAQHWSQFELHWRRQYLVLAVSEAVLQRAQDLVQRHPLRAYDAVHLASALQLVAVAAGFLGSPLEFWTADRQQARAAEGEGLTVELVQ